MWKFTLKKSSENNTSRPQFVGFLQRISGLRMSIFAFYTGITVSAIILASCMSGYFAYRELASEKIHNGKIVLYLELERMSGALGEFVTAQSSRLLPTKQAGTPVRVV